MVSAPEIVRTAFHQRFPDRSECRVFRAPGRVNLIGEHTDYNLGFVLPMAIDLACLTAIAPAAHGMLRVHSENLHAFHEWPIETIPDARPAGDWGDYVLGVAQQLVRSGFTINGSDLAIYSTVPVGAGLSSSASLEASTALALLRGQSISKKDLALLCQRAEREFVGVPCGIMDQYASVHGERGKALCIDCRSITHQSVELPDGVEIIVVNSMVKHELGATAYRDRVRECAEAVKELRVDSLRDARSSELAPLTGIPLKRARHVTTENERVEAFMIAAASGNLAAMGELFVASHRSLQHDYEVSCEELDFLVDTAISLNGVYGARMTGGGFGGCTVNLVSPGTVETFLSRISAAYEDSYGRSPQMFQFLPDDGAQEIF
ncbi:MAG: galactokinase [Bryobacteraceae bacterium]